MLYQSAGGACYMLVVCAAQGSLLPGLQLLATDATVALLLAAWAIALTIGTALVMTLVADYSAVVAICVTTLRKALSILCSFVLFPRHVGLGPSDWHGARARVGLRRQEGEEIAATRRRTPGGVRVWLVDVVT